MNAMKTKPLSHTRLLMTLLASSMATACLMMPEREEPEELPLRAERAQDTLQLSWDGGEVHRLEVLQCNEPLSPAGSDCECAGALVWGVGPGDTEKFHEVALQAPFIETPLQYGVTPASDRKNYAARPLVTGKTYSAIVTRVGPCDGDGRQDCQQTIARGCQRFVW